MAHRLQRGSLSYGQSFFPKCISAWNGLAQEIAEANTLDLFKQLSQQKKYISTGFTVFYRYRGRQELL